MNLSVTEIKKLLKNWHSYKASISSLENGGELQRKLDAIERSLTVLDEISFAIIKMRYFDKTEMEIIIKKAYVSRSNVYRRMEKAYTQMVYYLVNTP